MPEVTQSYTPPKQQLQQRNFLTVRAPNGDYVNILTAMHPIEWLLENEDYVLLGWHVVIGTEDEVARWGRRFL